MNALSLPRRGVKLAAWAAGSRPLTPTDVVILLYHRVVPRPAAEIELTPSVFARQIDRLARSGRVRSLDRALAGEGGVVVTFDDGTPDFHEEVLPVLDRHRLPVVLYVATGAVGARNGIGWGRLGDAAASGLVTFGSHTHDHVDLSRYDATTALEQMRRSKETIEDRLGVPCLDFAFPFAAASDTSRRVGSRLFRSLATDAWRINRAPVDRHDLGRTPILRNDGRFFFDRKASGGLEREASFYRLARRGPWRSS